MSDDHCLTSNWSRPASPLAHCGRYANLSESWIRSKGIAAMRRLTFVFLAAMIGGTPVVLAQDGSYKEYERTQKTVTELEWRLLQAQLELVPHRAFLSFEPSNQQFSLIVWITTRDAALMDSRMLREDFESTVNLAKALLARQFPRFKERGSNDLRARLLLGRSAGEEIASFDGSSVKFTESYYEYLKEIGRR